MKKLLLMIFIPAYLYGQPESIRINPDLFIKAWSAKWITHPEFEGTAYGVFHFRKILLLAKKPDKYIVHVSADNRYRLYVNGASVCFGPARGDIWHWRYETIDIAPYLHEGRNQIAALVINFGENRPVSQFTFKSAFILQGDTDQESAINTKPENGWKVYHNLAYHPLRIDWRAVNGFFAAGPSDSLNCKLYPWGWKSVDFNDSDWQSAGSIGYDGSGIPNGYHYFSGNSAWKLIPRSIPMMMEKTERLREIERANQYIPKDFLEGDSIVTIPGHSRIKILFDQTRLTKGYPNLIFSRGKNAMISVKYAESLIDNDGKKGNRNETEGKHLSGYYDVIIADGGFHRNFQPLWIRTFRYIELDIITDDEPLILEDFFNIYTGYPFEKKAWIITSDPTLERIFNTGWHTLEMCADETYWDCPYYEQLQYAGDTRTQTFISQYVSGDDRLFKNALELFDHSRISDGVTYSRYPSSIPQVTPAYSLMWVNMVYDYLMMGGDPRFTARFLNGMHAVLKFYEDHIDSTGMVGTIPYTNHIEARSGTPVNRIFGHSSQHNFLYAYTLKNAAKVFSFHGKKKKSSFYSTLADSINKATVKLCYDKGKKLFADSPLKQVYTQQANTLAILSGAVSQEKRPELMNRILSDTTLVPSYLFFKFYVFKAMKLSGMGNYYIDQLDRWKNLLNYGFTTWPEFDVESRSDCHAWSAHPTYDLLATVCGIEPDAPGFRRIRIEPHPGYLDHIEAEMPHPDGSIYINLTMEGQNGIKGDIRIPESTTGVFIWNRKHYLLVGGEQNFEFRE